MSANLSRNGKPGRNWQPHASHFGQVCALATKERTLSGVSIGLFAKVINVLQSR